MLEDEIKNTEDSEDIYVKYNIDKEKISPMMNEYLKTKQEYLDCILLYRLGDFYEMFFKDALTASKELEITLTGRACGLEEKAPMAGVPFHAANAYIIKLINKGYKVAICEQVEDPKEAKGLVKREVVKIITPGTISEEQGLEEKLSNYIMAIYYLNSSNYNIAVADITTGEFYATEIDERQGSAFPKVLDEMARFNPKELVINKSFSFNKECLKKIDAIFSTYVNIKEDEYFDGDLVHLCNKYEIKKEAEDEQETVFEQEFAKYAIIGLDKYIQETQKKDLENLNVIKLYRQNEFMSLDMSARKNLELTKRIKDGTKKGTLLSVLDKTMTAMGGRMLNTWINAPLIGKYQIENRLDAVEEFKENIILKGQLRELLRKVYDIERIAGKVAFSTINARDLIVLKNSIEFLPEIKEKMQETKTRLNREIANGLDSLKDIYDLIDKTIVDNPPITITEGNIIRPEINEELYELKQIGEKGKNWIISLEEQEKQKTGIPKLKVGYNKVFGYYVEITKSYLDKVPEEYIRKQTLVNAERFVTPELKEMEEKILTSQQKIIELEYKIFNAVKMEITANIKRIQKTSKNIARLDVLTTFAQVSEDNKYVRPKINESGEINIKNGRHPVVEKMLPYGEFVDNDTKMDSFGSVVHVITGPNMSR